MHIIPTPLPGLLEIHPTVFEDSRGYFFESYNRDLFIRNGVQTEFVQDNQSKSRRGVLRGLHYQLNPFAQAKLVRVLSGEVLDVAVDIRKSSPTYGQHFSIRLSGENRKMLFIPRGFAHGFLVLSETAEFFYKCDNLYNKESEAGIHFNDASLKINWGFPEQDLIISEKDQILPAFEYAANNFTFQI